MSEKRKVKYDWTRRVWVQRPDFWWHWNAFFRMWVHNRE